MKATELRIGNFVYDVHENKLHTITAYDILHLSEGMDSEVFKPIDITPEILLKAGFKQTYNHHCYKLQTRGGWVYEITGDIFLIDDSPIEKRILYVHQLQNIYFALVCEELNINL
jgi:hypothetical protein